MNKEIKGRPKTTYKLKLDYLREISKEAPFIIELYNNYIITYNEAKELIEKSLTPIEDRDKGYKELF
jgi:tRNA-dihydrouridine synthase